MIWSEIRDGLRNNPVADEVAELQQVIDYIEASPRWHKPGMDYAGETTNLLCALRDRQFSARALRAVRPKTWEAGWVLSVAVFEAEHQGSQPGEEREDLWPDLPKVDPHNWPGYVPHHYGHKQKTRAYHFDLCEPGCKFRPGCADPATREHNRAVSGGADPYRG